MLTYFDKTLSLRHTNDAIRDPETALKFMRETSGLAWDPAETTWATITKAEVLRTQDGWVIDLRADFDGNHQRYFGRILIEPQSDFTPLG